MTVKEFAKKYGVSERRVQYLIKQGRISAKMVYGHKYIIPDDTDYPRDDRYNHSHWYFSPCRKPVDTDNE